ncbi:hypothetical protein Patl1_13453 [Pistacia atlantica]|uniref:Uncharacterized protein n=1 Tax=Pistacia atlantica TaxID=434234 RepID=A0ACC1AS27_9ROSI|nr:hypothetical protein Patl1_13453 [Pistacia atlantica]
MGPDSLTATKPIPLPTHEDDRLNQSTSLLSFNTDSSEDSSSNTSQKPTTTIVFIALTLATCVALSAAAAFGFLFFSASSSSSSSSSSLKSTARPLKKLDKPVVLLISSDGFRFGYQFKTATPNIHRLINNGTEAETGLIPVFPSLTFPNHYSIVTGLYPAFHGIINNHFVDPDSGATFTMGSHEPKWWLGEPLWETVVNHGLKAATYFWPGSEDPDHQGHQVGPDDPQITEAVARIDSMIGRLIDGLEKRGVFEDVTIIMVAGWVQSYSPLLAIRPPAGYNPSDIVAKMNEGLIEEGFKVEQKKTNRKECGGAHGYDNAIFSMRTIFIGHGPQFERGKKVPSFENVQIYNLVTSILKIQGAANNGSSSFPKSVLLPTT